MARQKAALFRRGRLKRALAKSHPTMGAGYAVIRKKDFLRISEHATSINIHAGEFLYRAIVQAYPPYFQKFHSMGTNTGAGLSFSARGLEIPRGAA